jgi:hypothetical protein
MYAAHLNLVFAWCWILMGFISGVVHGLFFHRDNWLGGYGSFRRRLYRLAHISFFGLGSVNLFFYLTVRDRSPLPALLSFASWSFVAGGVLMPLCCFIMAHIPRARLAFGFPVGALLIGGLLTLIKCL